MPRNKRESLIYTVMMCFAIGYHYVTLRGTGRMHQIRSVEPVYDNLGYKYSEEFCDGTSTAADCCGASGEIYI